MNNSFVRRSAAAVTRMRSPKFRNASNSSTSGNTPRNLLLAAGIVCAMVTGLFSAAVVRAAPAHAGGCSGDVVCSIIVNDNAPGIPGILVQDKWCKNDQNMFAGDRLCDTNYMQRLLSSGESTNYLQDWDAVKFPRGCYGYFSTGARNYPVDRRGQVSAWFRVHNGEFAHVTMRCG